MYKMAKGKNKIIQNTLTSILFTHTHSSPQSYTHTQPHTQCTAASADLIPIVSCFLRGGGNAKLFHPGPRPGPGTLYYIDTYILLLMLPMCVRLYLCEACTYIHRQTVAAGFRFEWKLPFNRDSLKYFECIIL